MVGKYLSDKPPTLKLVLALGIAQATAGEVDGAKISFEQLQRGSQDLPDATREQFQQEAGEILEVSIADAELREELIRYLIPTEGEAETEEETEE